MAQSDDDQDNYYARIDGKLVRGETEADGSFLVEYYDPDTGEFVADIDLLTELLTPAQEGVTDYESMTKEEFDAAVANEKA